MKKVMLFLMLACFTLGSSGFKSLNESENELENCHQFALESCAVESQAFNKIMSFDEFAEAYTFYYNFCVGVFN